MCISVVTLSESTRFKRERKQAIMLDIFEHTKRVILSREERAVVDADGCIGKFGKSISYYLKRKA